MEMIVVFTAFGFLFGLAMVERVRESNDSPTAKGVVSAVIIVGTTAVGCFGGFVINLIAKLF